MTRHIIGIDIGGTSIKTGFISDEGSVLKKWEVPTQQTNNDRDILENIWMSIEEAYRQGNMNKEQALGIGVGVPGFTNIEKGIVYESVNISWKNVDLRNRLHEMSGMDVYVANDANVAVLGENWCGAGNQAKNVIAITIGTGIGGGVIANGKLLNGENGTAGEFGHIIIDPEGYPCNCGRRGCLETIASATAITRLAKDAAGSTPRSQLARTYHERGDLNAKNVIDLAKEGEKESLAIVHDVFDALGLTLSNIATLFNPSKILIGGGVSKAGDFLLEGIEKAFRTYALPRVTNVCEMKLARLGNDAGMIGAAFLVKEQMENAAF